MTFIYGLVILYLISLVSSTRIEFTGILGVARGIAVIYGLGYIFRQVTGL